MYVVVRRSIGTLQALNKTKPEGVSLWQHVRNLKDPFVAAVLLEDAAATSGAVIAAAGIGLTQYTGMPMFDSLGSISVGVLLAGVAVRLVRMNQQFLLGTRIDPQIETGIREIIAARDNVEAVHNVR